MSDVSDMLHIVSSMMSKHETGGCLLVLLLSILYILIVHSIFVLSTLALDNTVVCFYIQCVHVCMYVHPYVFVLVPLSNKQSQK